MCEMHRGRFRRNGSLESKRIIGDDAARFWSYVDQDGPMPEHRSDLGPCWVWTGGRSNFGHGVTHGGNLNIRLAHRLSWHLNVGPIPEGLCVLHHCDNPPCVRPEHLFLGTKADNTADMIGKGRDRFEPGVEALRAFHVGTDNPQAKMTEERVIELRQRAAAGEHFRDLAPEFGISASRANAIILGNAWRHVWPYGHIK